MAGYVTMKVSPRVHRRLIAIQQVGRDVKGRQYTINEMLEDLIELWESVNGRLLDGGAQ